ncbi:hypothetical protein LEP1GSC038_4801 [Leptospira weilii str. 2006001855]|uniref:Uncharacterized protein n=1 Tax=Leptospira weilii str. 2006001855 TaxID=996804 RepID=M6G5W7_9LEPT|nr:hypothetical protein LEP1GSC038_4801 [Leptospira weilii str. 2006001855]
MLVVWSSSHVPCKVFDCLPLRREKLNTTLPKGRVVGFWLNVLMISNLFFKDNDLEKTIQEISSQNSF